MVLLERMLGDSLGGEHKPVEFCDFAGFSKTGNEACFRNFSATELKHGRAAMMAVVDAVVQRYVELWSLQCGRS